MHRSRDLGPLAADWARAASPEPASCFQSFALAQCWAAVFGGAVELRVWHASAPAWILPWVIAGGTLSLLGHGLFDYADVIAAPEAAGALQALIPGLAARLGAEPGWERMEIRAVPGDSPFLEFWRGLAAALAAAGRTAVLEPYSAAPRLLRREDAPVTPETFDALHRRAAARLRQSLRRGRLGPITDPARRQEWLVWMLAQKDLRLQLRGQSNVLRQTEAEWLQAMARRHPQLAEIWGYACETRKTAGFLTFLTPAVRYGYLLAFDPEAARCSPAIALLYFVLRRTVGEGREFDFLTGEQAYKLRFANAARRLWRLRVSSTPAANFP